MNPSRDWCKRALGIPSLLRGPTDREPRDSGRQHSQTAVQSTDTICDPKDVRNQLCTVAPPEDLIDTPTSEADDIDLPPYLLYPCTMPGKVVATVKQLYTQRYRTMSCDLAGVIDTEVPKSPTTCSPARLCSCTYGKTKPSIAEKFNLT